MQFGIDIKKSKMIGDYVVYNKYDRENFREIKEGDIFYMAQDRVRVLAKVHKVEWRYENGKEFYWFPMKYIARRDLQTGEVKRWSEDKDGFLFSYSCNQETGIQRHFPARSWGFKIESKNLDGYLDAFSEMATLDDACEAE